MPVAAELPRYQCHKKVWALKIAAIEIHADKSATIAPAESRYAPFDTVPFTMFMAGEPMKPATNRLLGRS